MPKSDPGEEIIKLLARDAATKRKNQELINQAVELAVNYGGIDGAHHKAWVIDQMVRALTGDNYEAVVTDAKNGEDGPDTYEWDEGIAP